MTDEKMNSPEDAVAQANAAETGPNGDETVDNSGDLQNQLEKEKAKSAEYLDNWRRAAADLSNYRKRVEKDASEMSKFANSALIARILPVLDDFDRAFQTLPANLRDLTWVDGITLIQRKLAAILEAEGLKPIQAMGKPFDPNFHEAVIHEENDQHDEGTVTGELQRGYLLNDRVLRPTLVKVSKKKSA